MENFNAAFAYLLSDEGTKFTDSPDDRGGKTKFGVTQKSYSAFLSRDASDQEMENMTEVQAKAFYYKMFWEPSHLGLITSQNVATALLDTEVNVGPGTGIKLAQSALNLHDDGIMGPATLKAINSVDEKEFIEAFHKKVMERYEMIVAHHPEQSRFIAGWTNRANKLLGLV